EQLTGRGARPLVAVSTPNHGGPSPMSHANARLTVHGRRLIIERLEQVWSQANVAASMGVSRSTVAKWSRRYRDEGEAGLAGRSSRAHPRRHALAAQVREAFSR